MNYQNIPRKDKVVKRAFRPKEEGGALGFFDFGQIEARLAAYFMAKLGWNGLLDDIIAGVDVHRRMASIIYQVPQAEVTEQMRDRAKTCFFGMLYGAGARRFSEILNASGPGQWFEWCGKRISQTEARAVVETFRDEMPGLEILQSACERQAKRNGYIELYTGRQLRPEPYGEHKLPNALIQGTAAELMKRAIGRVHLWLETREDICSQMVATIHDEIMTDGPLAEMKTLATVIPPLMIEPMFHEVVPIMVEVEFSTETWADKKEWEG